MDIRDLPISESMRRIDFDTAEVVPGVFPDTWFLVVTGTAPCQNMEVTLIEMYYIEKPDYWGIEVIGSLPGGVCLTATKPFTAVLPLDGNTGYIGVEVFGATKSEKLPVPPDSPV